MMGGFFVSEENGQTPPDGFGAGAIPGMEMGPGAEVRLSQEQQATREAVRSSVGVNFSIPPSILGALIEYLQQFSIG